MKLELVKNINFVIKKMQKSVIIVAGGSGSRMQTEIPKQFLELAGLPILMRTINTFSEFDKKMKIILVLPEDQVAYWEQLCQKYHFTAKIHIAYGGATRFESVKNGLKFISDNELVGVHDGVRPLVSANTLEQCYTCALAQGNAVPVIDAFESIRHVDANKSKAINRELIKLVQTPQVFQSEILLKAYEQEFTSLFTDDASVVEKAGYEIKLVNGNRENIKITTPIDMRIAEALLIS